jgi:hypothetical protein
VRLWLGLATIDHEEPFHRSTSVLKCEPSFQAPTATQSLGSGHRTSTRPLSVAPPGTGADDRVHADPFQCSMNSRPDPDDCDPDLPTAKQSGPEMHAIAWSPSSWLRFQLGLGTIDHDVPFHLSTSVCM